MKRFVIKNKKLGRGIANSNIFVKLSQVDQTLPNIFCMFSIRKIVWELKKCVLLLRAEFIILMV